MNLFKCFLSSFILISLSYTLLAQTNSFNKLEQQQIQLKITEPQIPILTNAKHNILLEFEIESYKKQNFNRVLLNLQGEALKYIKSFKLYCTANISVIASQSSATALHSDKNVFGSTSRIFAEPEYSQLVTSINYNKKDSIIDFNIHTEVLKGKNYYWIGVETETIVPLTATFKVEDFKLYIDNQEIKSEYTPRDIRRFAYGLRNHGDDGVFAFRIPGLVQTNKGNLMAVYDIRHNVSADLQGHIDVGLSRSLDNGFSWLNMQTIIDMGCYGNKPEGLNGVGDPAILVDTKSGRIWVAGLWTHGMDGAMAWHNSKSGMTAEDETGQIVLVYSDDEGESWSTPINITEQVKDSSWRLFFQGPGAGITMTDGTLVFACQHIDSTGMPYSGILYSKDKGQTWQAQHTNYPNTTESQVVELNPGTLMLNMRDNRGATRAVFITHNMGKTWQQHKSSRSVLIDPVCMASIIKIPANKNIYQQDILLFSNPQSEKGRKNMSIQISFDYGNTWHSKKLLLDSEYGWGYSCLTRVDNETIAILYEGSTAQIVFQKIALKEFMR